VDPGVFRSTAVGLVSLPAGLPPVVLQSPSRTSSVPCPWARRRPRAPASSRTSSPEVRRPFNAPSPENPLPGVRCPVRPLPDVPSCGRLVAGFQPRFGPPSPFLTTLTVSSSPEEQAAPSLPSPETRCILAGRAACASLGVARRSPTSSRLPPRSLPARRLVYLARSGSAPRAPGPVVCFDHSRSWGLIPPAPRPIEIGWGMGASDPAASRPGSRSGRSGPGSSRCCHPAASRAVAPFPSAHRSAGPSGSEDPSVPPVRFRPSPRGELLPPCLRTRRSR
jgi:hypothetical protein